MSTHPRPSPLTTNLTTSSLQPVLLQKIPSPLRPTRDISSHKLNTTFHHTLYSSWYGNLACDVMGWDGSTWEESSATPTSSSTTTCPFNIQLHPGQHVASPPSHFSSDVATNFHLASTFAFLFLFQGTDRQAQPKHGHYTPHQTRPHYCTKTSSFNNTWWRQENTISPNETPLSPFHTSSIPCSHHSRYPSMDHSSKLPSTATLRYASQSPNRTTLHLPINLSQQHIPTFNTKLLIIALPKPRHFHQIPNLVNSLTILVPTFLHRTFHTPPDATLPAKTFSFSPSINVKVKYQPHA